MPAPGAVGTIDVVTSTSESAQFTPNVDGFGDGVDWSADGVGVLVGGADADVDADADGPKGINDVDDVGVTDADDEAVAPACERPASPALDGFDPHEYTISRMIRSNPPSTIARRRQ